METTHLHYVYKHFRFLGSGGVNLHETEHYIGRHGRAYHWRRGTQQQWKPAIKGGYTICYVYDEKGALVSTGTAQCSKADSFCYYLGREIARGRAIKTFQQAKFDEQVINWHRHYAEEVAV